MTKIKNFRITLRAREIARWLKRERGMETTPELELTIEELVKSAKTYLAPAAVYTTLTRPVAEKTTSLSFPEKSIAVSIMAISIGPGLDEEYTRIQTDSAKEPLWAALKQEALSQTVQFVSRLLADQAKEEDCEMSLPMVSEDPQAASALATLVGVQRIGIDLPARQTGPEGSVALLPVYSRVAWTFWTPIPKGAGRRAEKVAA